MVGLNKGSARAADAIYRLGTRSSERSAHKCELGAEEPPSGLRRSDGGLRGSGRDRESGRSDHTHHPAPHRNAVSDRRQAELLCNRCGVTERFCLKFNCERTRAELPCRDGPALANVGCQSTRYCPVYLRNR